MRTTIPALFVIGLMVAWAVKVRQAESSPAPQMDNRASEQLAKMSDFLANTRNFQVDGQSSLDVVLESGQKVQYNASSKVDVSRPYLKSRRVGPFADVLFLYDGQQFVLYDRVRNIYAVTDAPKDFDQALTDARERLDLQAPGADLLYTDVYEGLMEDVTSLEYLGIEALDGIRTHHLAARKKEVDWQLWIEDGPTPFPRKYVITTTSLPQAPQFEVVLRNWNSSPTFAKGAFTFQAPEPEFDSRSGRQEARPE